MGRNALAILGLGLVLLSAASARAEADLFSRDTFSGLVDLRLAATDGETSWVDGGAGKTRFGAGRTGVRLGEAAMVWNPRLHDALSVVVIAESQDSQSHLVDVGEAYLNWRSSPGSHLRLSARAGLIYPPISLEHDGLDWSVPDMITPSAVNSWVAEETKVIGVELTGRRMIGGQAVGVTVGAFTHGDTSGTLLTFRGWALHDVKSPGLGRFPLPPLAPSMARRQAPSTTPLREIDGIVGYYGRLEWRPDPRLMIDLFHYDNQGDRTSVVEKEWSWETRFTNLGLRLDLDRFHWRAQVMTGETLMGYSNANGIWADVGFEAAYISASHDLGPGSLTGRLDHFSTSDRTNKATDNNAEHGWSAVAAYRWDVRPDMQILFEALRIDSYRPARDQYGISRRQTQNLMQTALRRQF